VAVTPGKIATGAGDFLDTTKVDTPAGAGLHREAVFLGDPEDPSARGAVRNAAPASGDYGGVVRIPEPAAAAVTQPGQSAVTILLLPANAARRGLVIANAPTSTADLLVAFAAVASAASYTRRIPPGATWERCGGYTGAVSGIWEAVGGGHAAVTEEA
jgi:hypothetical protein